MKKLLTGLCLLLALTLISNEVVYAGRKPRGKGRQQARRAAISDVDFEALVEADYMREIEKQARLDAASGSYNPPKSSSAKEFYDQIYSEVSRD